MTILHVQPVIMYMDMYNYTYPYTCTTCNYVHVIMYMDMYNYTYPYTCTTCNYVHVYGYV